ncbi:hypothetical protein SS50377_24806 [Spironucleus salmonicida]|uniref:Myb-like DNA-binding domain-containing protein n=1 Tax=Spironucleus salmonicida TaxID=348837 RepID=V6LTK7_9EUKA|nr:hypothetical protein SS50377_24786 [Spironucleus salmonicida]KAH0572694.1 hypothetical protein SS50377_24806 [Spironucleus salmonicida]|eukprot:EST44124.1 Hypothetical protein SS50377_16082 [Spironucleus salmonicida]
MDSVINQLILILGTQDVYDMADHNQEVPSHHAFLRQDYNLWTFQMKQRLVHSVRKHGYDLKQIQRSDFPEMTRVQIKNQYFYLKRLGRFDQ